ncbi:MAG: trzN, partial [Actinomycetia bacterium]|nr:trzN [Actinomycetes bacterium]
ACLGRDDLGVLAPGRRADLAAWDLRTVDRVGVHDPLAGLVLTGLSSHASLVAVGGRILVEGGVPTFDVAAIAARAREAVPCC